MGPPVCIAQLVCDQSVRCFGVRNAQESLRQREECDPFLCVQPVFVEELIDPARALGGPQVSDQVGSAIDDPGTLVRRGARPGEQRAQHVGLRRAIELTHE